MTYLVFDCRDGKVERLLGTCSEDQILEEAVDVMISFPREFMMGATYWTKAWAFQGKAQAVWLKTGTKPIRYN